MMPENVEMGDSNTWKIESIINWSRMVQLFYTYQGTSEEDEETKPLSPPVSVDDIKVSIDNDNKTT